MSLEQAKKDLEKKKEEELLIAGLVALAAEIKQAQVFWSRSKQLISKREQKRQYDEIIRSALSKKESGIHTFHRIHALGGAIKQVERQLELYNIPKQVISDVLEAGGYPPLESNDYSPFSWRQTSCALFSPSKNNSLKLGSLALVGTLGSVGLFTAIALLIKSAVIVKTAATVLAVTAVASTAFPPAMIAMLAIGGTALLIAGIGLAVIAFQHSRMKNEEAQRRLFYARG